MSARSRRRPAPTRPLTDADWCVILSLATTCLAVVLCAVWQGLTRN